MKNKIAIFFAVIFSVLFLSSCTQNINTVAKNLTTYTLTIDYDHNQKTLQAQQKVDYINNTDFIFEQLCFHLYPNAFRQNSIQKVVSLGSFLEAYPNGESFGHIEIQNVVCGRQELEFWIDGYDENILFVALPKKLYPNDRIELQISFVVVLPNINHRFGYGNNAVNIANFYPIACVVEQGKFVMSPYHSNGDPFYSDVANYFVTITYDQSLVLASTGVQNSHTTQNGKTTTAMSAKAVRDFAMVLSEKFQIASQKVGNTTVLYYYHNDENFEQSLQTSVDSLKTFSQTFGGYPYATLSVVQTNFVHGGMEYPCLVYISDALKSYKDYQNVIVHEIAHQWWYGLVGSNQYNNAWQDEGLTDYSTALFYQKNPSYQIDMEEIINTGVKSYHFFTQVYGAVYKQLDTSMNRALNEYENENEYVYIAYVKGMLLFDSLNALIGDKNFFEGLRLYVKTYSYKNAQPYDLIWAFEKASGMHLEGFFDSWIEGKVIVMAS